MDDNEAVLLQFNNEEYITDGWRTTFIPMAKARQHLILHSLVTGVASDSFYRKREALADAVIDFMASEEGGRLEYFVRLRALRGARVDSSWRRMEVFERNRVRLSSWRQVFGFRSEDAERIFDYLLRSFVEDHFRGNQSADSSGWRSLVDMAKGIGAPKTSLYSESSSASLGELLSRGVVERMILVGLRGRGGRVTRMWIAYGKGFVREYVDRYAKM